MMTHGVGVGKEAFSRPSTESVSPKQIKNVPSTKVVNINLKRIKTKVRVIITNVVS